MTTLSQKSIKKTLSLGKILRTAKLHMINLQFAITELLDYMTDRMSTIFN